MSDPHASLSEINGISILTRSGKLKSRYSKSERLQIIGGTPKDLEAFIALFCPDAPLYAKTRGKTDDPRDWSTPRGRLTEDEVVKHLTGNIIPGITPRWVAPRSWEVTMWVGIDVDFRGDRADFSKRCQFVLSALKGVGITGKHILKSITPSGGRHYRFFLDRKVRVWEIENVLNRIGLYESSGQIEIFPRKTKGMRLPFGHVPGQTHDPNQWQSFIRKYRTGRFPKVIWRDFLQRTKEIAQLDESTANQSGIESKHQPSARLKSRRAIGCSLGVPRSKQSSPDNKKNKIRYLELLSRPFGHVSDAKELWDLGIQAPGTRTEATKRLAWHYIHAKSIHPEEAAKQIVEWVYETGKGTSKDVQQDLTNGTQYVADQTKSIVEWMVLHGNASEVYSKDLTFISTHEIHAICEILEDEIQNDRLVASALRFLRFAKLHGNDCENGWEVQIAINGVVRKWPECRGSNYYKPIIDSLVEKGLIIRTREKRQTENGTGRPRTYKIHVAPSLRSEASLTHDEAIEYIYQKADSQNAADQSASTVYTEPDTYRMFKHPTHPEKMDEANTEVRQDIQRSEKCQSTTRSSSGLKYLMKLEQARYAQVPDPEKLSLIGTSTSISRNENDSVRSESISNKGNDVPVLAMQDNNPVSLSIFRNQKRIDHLDGRVPLKRSLRPINKPEHSTVTTHNYLQEQLHEQSINRIISIDPVNSS